MVVVVFGHGVKMAGGDGGSGAEGLEVAVVLLGDEVTTVGG